jgi:phosphoglycolate phosphatase
VCPAHGLARLIISGRFGTPPRVQPNITDSKCPHFVGICEAVWMTSGAVGFDLDMTLIDSLPQILESFHALAEETDIEIDLDVIEARLGIKLEDELAHWFAPHDVAGAAATYRHHYARLAALGTVVLPGAHDAMAAVRASGRAVAIITAKHQSSVEPCLVATGISPDTLHAFVHGREKAEVLRNIAAAMYVGDTPDDMTAARDAGVVAIGVATGAFTATDLLQAGASTALHSLSAFPDAYASFL